MITKDNFKEIILSLDKKHKKRILDSNKEYCVLYLHVFNSGWYCTIKLTDNFSRYKNVSNNGNAIVYTKEISQILKTN
jgi:hypothetical protein